MSRHKGIKKAEVMDWEPYTQRQKGVPDVFTYDFPVTIRSRIIYTLNLHLEYSHFPIVQEKVEKRLLAQYGYLEDSNLAHGKLQKHIFGCADDQIIDYLECVFFYLYLHAWAFARSSVDCINDLFRQEGIGFEFTNYVLEEPPPSSGTGSKQIKNPLRVIHYPKAIRKDSQLIHIEVVLPCLHFLTHPDFLIANEEMLDAYGDYRAGSFDSAITRCSESFESVIKTICTKKGWQYDPAKDAWSNLVGVCKSNNLFDSFYVTAFTGTGTIRNKIGLAHGKGPNPLHQPATKEQALHFLNLVASHILFLKDRAGYS